MKFFSFLLLFMFMSSFALAQTCVSGKVTNPKLGEELINATLYLFKEGVFVQGSVTDFNGDYKINVDPGTYDVQCSYLGYADKRIEDVVIKAGQNTKLNIEMGDYKETDCGLVHYDYAIPLIEKGPTTRQVAIDSKTISRSPIRGVKKIAATAAGVSFQ